MTTKTDIIEVYTRIKGVQKPHTKAVEYYEGEHPLVYSVTRMNDLYGNTDKKFIENICGVVVETIQDRIQLSGFEVPKALADMVSKIYTRNRLGLESDDLHEKVLVTGEGYLIVQLGDKGAEIFYNDPRLCTAVYTPENPRVMSYAGKLWQGIDGKERLTLYYTDRTERYITTKKQETGGKTIGVPAFVLDSNAEGKGIVKNETTRIPLFHFRLNRRSKPMGVLHDVIPMQDAINKLFTDMMIAGEYTAFRQRYVVSNANISTLKNAPNEIWAIPASGEGEEPTKVGEFGATDLNNYMEPMGALMNNISKITGIPRHYFNTTAGDPSGEALITMESALVKRAKRITERLVEPWQEAMVYALELEGKPGIDLADVVPTWEITETVQPKTLAEIRNYARSAGIPLVTLLRREGWSESEIEKMLQEKGTEDAVLADNLLAKLEKGQ